MARIRVGDAEETVVTRDEWPLERALESLKDETIAVLGYGVQGPGQSLNLRDNGFPVIVGQRRDSASWDKAIEDGWIEGETLLTGERGASVQSGHEAKVVIEECGRADYRERLDAELGEMADQEIWRAGRQLRELRP